MIETLPTLARDCALALSALVAASWWFGDGALAVATGVSGMVAIVNLMLLGLVVRAVAHASAHEQGMGKVLGLLSGKMIFMLGGFTFLVSFFGSLGPAIGASAVILGLTVRGFVDALQVSDDELAEGVR